MFCVCLCVSKVLVTVEDVNDNAPTCLLSFSESYVLAENRTNRTIWIHEEIDASATSPLTLAYITLSDLDSAASNGHSLSASLVSIRYVNASSLDIQPEASSNVTPSFRLVPIIAQYGNYYYALQLTNRLDRERTLYFDLTMRMSDNERPGAEHSASLTSYFDLRVILSDLNDNYPEFRNTELVRNEQGVVQFEYLTFSVPENQLTLNFATVDAFDPDGIASARLDYRILDENNMDLVNLYSKYVTGSETSASRNRFENEINPNYLFFISPENGTLSLRAELDRERKEVYLFTVRVNDTDHASDILVEVHLLDVNDNQPVYQIERIEFGLAENGGENAFVGNVRATDPDLTPTTEYFIEPYEMNRFFYVESETGNLMAKLSLDAEDPTLPSILTVNHTFELVIYARDPYFLNTTSVDLRHMSKLNVSVRLLDVNDHRPVLRAKTENDLIRFDLNKYANSTSSCQNMNLVLSSLESVDLDRDSTPAHAHFYKFAYIRRLSWQFVYEIVKAELAGNVNVSQRRLNINQSTMNHELLKFIESLIVVQNKYDIRPVSKVNLRSVFLLEQNADRTVLNQVNVSLNQLCKLNWGVYNLSVLVSEQSTGTFTSDYSLKMFVFNSFYEPSINISDSHLDLLNTLIESWWAANSNLIVGMKRRIDAPTAQTGKQDDNGDYIDGITQEYFKFYASSAFSRRATNAFWDLTNLMVFNTSASNSVIMLIAAFLVISLFLILFISYKQYRSSKSSSSSSSSTAELRKHLTRSHSPGTKKSPGFLNISVSRDKSDTSSSTSSSDAVSSAKQSTKDLSGSPDMAASKINSKKLKVIIIFIFLKFPYLTNTPLYAHFLLSPSVPLSIIINIYILRAFY